MILTAKHFSYKGSDIPARKGGILFCARKQYWPLPPMTHGNSRTWTQQHFNHSATADPYRTHNIVISCTEMKLQRILH